MSLWLGCGLLLKEAGFGSRQRRHRDFRRRAAPRIALCSFMVVLISVAIILARSRGTWFSLALGSCFYLYLQVRALCRNTRYAVWSALALAPLVLCIAGVTYYILRGSEDYVQETGVEASFAARINAWKGVLPMIAANPISGTGLGTFSLAYPRYKIYGETVIWDQAHNEYLQAFAESGLIGGAILVWGLVVFWRRRLSPLLSNRWQAQPPVALGAALGVLVLWIHSLVEFNLQIPANGLLFVLLGALVFAAKSRTERGKESTSSAPPGPAGYSPKSLTDAALTLQ
jgi:O-antigen ligase